MHANEYVVSVFALIILIFFCSPIFALAIGVWAGMPPSSFSLKMFVGLTDTDVVNSLHSLMLPLVGAVVIFRSDYFTGVFGTILLATMCAGIITGFFVFIIMNPSIFGETERVRPYINEYADVHKSIFEMISMLMLLFLAKLGITDQRGTKTGEVYPVKDEQPDRIDRALIDSEKEQTSAAV